MNVTVKTNDRCKTTVINRYSPSDYKELSKMLDDGSFYPKYIVPDEDKIYILQFGRYVSSEIIRELDLVLFEQLDLDEIIKRIKK